MGDLAGSDIVGLLLEQLPHPVAIVDTDMRYIACNARWFSDYRLASTEVVGRSHYDVFPEIGERWKQEHALAQSGETVSGGIEPFERSDGSLDWVKWKLVPWHRATGAIGGIILFTELVTEPMDATKADVLAAELDLLIEAANQHAIFLLDRNGCVRAWNAGAQRMFGWSADDINGRHHALLFAPGQASGPQADLFEWADQQSGKFPRQLVARRKDGSQFFAGVTIGSIDRHRQLLARHVVAVHDMSAEIERAKTAEANDAYHRAILDTVPDAMVTIDQDGLILWFSHTAEQLFGYRADEVIGRNVSMLMPDDEALLHDEYLDHYSRTGQKKVIGAVRRVYGRRKDGARFPHALFIGEANGGGRRVFTGFLRDLSQQEEAETQIRELQAELIHMSRVLAVGTMAGALAHELNQPLTAIANYVQTSAALLPETTGDLLDIMRDALDLAGQEALRAGAIIHRLREFVASGELERSIASPAELAMQALDLGAVGARLRGIACNVRIAPELPRVLVDRIQIQQVLLNLVRNAMEAMEDRGTLTIEARRAGSMIRFSVVDTGPGLTLGQEDAVFEPFISSKASGMGMGLAICRTIINAHGGTMWCEETPGGGATFLFTVPLAEGPDA